MSSNTDFNALSDADFRKFLEDWLAANYPPEWRQDLRRPFRRLFHRLFHRQRSPPRLARRLRSGGGGSPSKSGREGM